MTLLATAILQLIKIIYFFYNRQLYGFSRISEPHFCYSAAFASKPSERDNYKDTRAFVSFVFDKICRLVWGTMPQASEANSKNWYDLAHKTQMELNQIDRGL